jgi:tetratricopeptide (TPR) repeat protein/predicted Ser/Thr protein kinase
MRDGDLLGRYTLLHLLGRGGMGEVWKAIDPALGRPVAIKLLLQQEPEDLKRFEREAALAARLAHPNIGAIFEFGLAGSTPYIAMQFIDGAPLDRESPSAREAAGIIRDAARAVQAAHSQGVIHRDLKPSNLILDRSRRVYVMDFGLAKPVKAEASLTQSGMMVGTPSFMPPEQAQALPVDARSDVYSLGATLYALVTGRPPFVGDNLFELLGDVCTRDPVAPSRLNRSLDRDLETIILKALEKEPARRYESASALADDLENWLAGDAISARPPSTFYRLSRRIRKHPLPFALGALLLVATAALPAALLLQRSRTERASRAAAAAHLDQADALAAEGTVPRLIAADEHLRAAGETGASRRLELNRRLGRLALDRGDYGVARMAFAVCRSLGDPTDFEKLVSDREYEVLRRRGERIDAALDDIGRGLGREGRPRDAHLLEDYVLEIIQYADLQTVDKLAEALRPMETAARAGGPSSAWKQSDRDIMTFAFRVLGRINLDGAVEPLSRMMSVLWDDELAAECGEALCNTRRAAAAPALQAAKDRFGLSGAAWSRIARLLPRIPTAPASAAQSDYDGLIRQGHAEMDRDDDPRAVETFARAVALDPSRALGWCCRGTAKFGTGDLDGSIADLTKAIELDPSHSRSWHYRARSRDARGDVDGAIQDYTRAIELEGEPDAWVGRGVIRARRKEWEAARADFTAAIDADPRLAVAWSNRGVVHMNLGRHPEAVEDLTAALRLDPKDAHSYFVRGTSKLRTGDETAALADFSSCIEVDPRNAEAFLHRGILRGNRGDGRGALLDFSRTLELEPDNVPALHNRGTARLREGDADGANRDFDHALSIEPDHPDSLLNRGALRLQRRDFDGALADFDRLVRGHPRRFEGWSNRGLTRLRMGDRERALPDFDRAIELDPGVADVWANRALVHHLAERWDEARRNYDRALELDPKHLTARQNRAALLAQRGQFEASLADWEKLIELAPDHPRIADFRRFADEARDEIRQRRKP